MTSMTTPDPAAPALRVAVVGAGAVGAVLGGRLTTVGADVTFVARGATLAALRERGLVLESPQGDVRLPPGHVRHLSEVPSVTFGSRATGALADGPAATLGRLADAFRRAGVTVDEPADTTAALWEKFLFVEPLGAVGGAARATFGELLAIPETRAILEACVHEVLAVGRGAGAVLPDDAPADVWERYLRLPAGGTTSMQRDLVAGRPSELDAQTGAVTRIGRVHGVPTPVHDVLYAALRPQEARARAR
jgi:2-dehydropantoate 2-reductase